MVTFSEFFGLINLLILAGYAYEICTYLYNRRKYPVIYDQIRSRDFEFWEQAAATPEFRAVFTFLLIHAVIVFYILGGVKLPLIALFIAVFYCEVLNSTAKQLIRDAKINGQKQQAGQKPEEKQKQNTHTDDGFGFDPGRFGDNPSWSTAEAEADYENALREAQKWVDDAKSETTIRGAINIFETRTNDPKIHPKDKLRYKLSIMMLKEKLKKFENGSPPLKIT